MTDEYVDDETDDSEYVEGKYEKMTLEELLAIVTPDQLAQAERIVKEPLFPGDIVDMKSALEAVLDCDDPENVGDDDEDWDAQVQVQVPTVSKKK